MKLKKALLIATELAASTSMVPSMNGWRMPSFILIQCLHLNLIFLLKAACITELIMLPEVIESELYWFLCVNCDTLCFQHDNLDVIIINCNGLNVGDE